MKIAFTGGGTAGHAMVNTILIPYLQKNSCSIIYVGSHNGMEKDMVQAMDNIKYYGISTGKLRRYFSLQNLTDIFRILKGCLDAYKILKAERPNVVYSGGGYVCVPVVYAAKCLRIPVVIKETDYSMGLANRLCLPFAQIVYTTFPDTKMQLPKNLSHYPGVLVRPSLYDKPQDAPVFTTQEKPLCLIFGGSTGSRIINEAVWNGLNYLTQRYYVVHICGKGNLNKEANANPLYQQFEYIYDEMGAYLNAADVIVTRCGSNAIWETLALGKKTVCIPMTSKSSRGEQSQNARFAVKNGNAVLLEESNLNQTTLRLAIDQAMSLKNETPYKLSQIQLQENIHAHISQICHIGENKSTKLNTTRKNRGANL